jgi:hypothetical protein
MRNKNIFNQTGLSAITPPHLSTKYGKVCTIVRKLSQVFMVLLMLSSITLNSNKTFGQSGTGCPPVGNSHPNCDPCATTPWRGPYTAVVYIPAGSTMPCCSLKVTYLYKACPPPGKNCTFSITGYQLLGCNTTLPGCSPGYTWGTDFEAMKNAAEDALVLNNPYCPVTNGCHDDYEVVAPVCVYASGDCLGECDPSNSTCCRKTKTVCKNPTTGVITITQTVVRQGPPCPLTVPPGTLPCKDNCHN